MVKSIFSAWNKLSLVKRIIIGLIVGIILSFLAPEKLSFITIFGTLFVSALKAAAPVLVLFLVASAIAQHKTGQKTNLKTVICLYIIGTLTAGIIAVLASFAFPVTIALSKGVEAADITPPSGIAEVFQTLLGNIVSNPIASIADANYIGVLAWAVILGVALRHSADSTKKVISDVADALTTIIRWIIQFAPLGVMGLVFSSIAESGVESLISYGKLILVLVGCMLVVAFITNPLIVFLAAHRNPYPLVLKCIKDSGITAFFTRSSAANIPVNMQLCEELKLDKDTYSISIPLGATINMAGAAVTISVLTLAAAHTLGIQVDLPSAILLCFMSALGACGTSGVAGGSILLIPMAAALFGIPADIAAQIVGVGFIVGVIQDSCETALNSSTDAVLTATAEYRRMWKESKKA
ncbi:MAG: serine/threonine transporter SstT [Firmicutes bacterium]|nr:serine/threonine transporter SstT [Bacillota bacterium]